jgi:hypothetical protein
MKINEKYPLIMKDVYSFDLRSCHYNIMKHLGYNLSGIDEHNKVERNIAIGKMMKKNIDLTNKLRETTRSIIDEYLLINNVADNDLILRQYDGFITKRNVQNRTLHSIPLDFRSNFEIFICSINRNSYIAKDSNTKEITIKGVSYNYSGLKTIYQQLCDLNYANKERLFSQLHRLKIGFYNSEDSSLFGIPLSNGKYKILLKEYGEMEISESILKLIDTSDIDKTFYFKTYFEPFTKSIVFENVR